MVRIEVQADGTILRKYPPIKGVAFYSDWLEILLARGAAVIRKELNRKTGQHEDKIYPLSADMAAGGQLAEVNASGSAGIRCIGCGKPMFGEVHQGGKVVLKSGQSNIKFDRIRIGGRIQVKEDTQSGVDETTRKWRRQWVFKEGIGCEQCREVFDRLVREHNTESQIQTAMSTVLARRAVKETEVRKHRIGEIGGDGRTTKSVKLPSAQPVFINVFQGTEEDLMDEETPV